MLSAEKKFRHAAARLLDGGGVLAALSGGADSVCLLHLLLSFRADSGADFPVAAAHLNHGLRGAEADRDEAFCAALCQKLGVRFFSARKNAAEYAKQNGRGVEEAGRGLRYAFFEEILQKHPEFSEIATAHNQGDLCETMLFHLARGTGLRGLCSIPARRGNIIRPLLDVSRAEILEYNRQMELDFVTDSTNDLTVYSRNRLRLRVLPELEAVFAGCAENMARSAALFRKDADYLDGEAKKVYDRLENNGCLNTKPAQNIHEALLSRVLLLLYNNSGFSDLGAVHIAALCEKITGGCENFTLSLPGARAVCARGILYFEAEAPAPAPDAFSHLIIPGVPVRLENGVLLLVTAQPNPAGFEGAHRARIRPEFAARPLTVRSRRAGDRIVSLGTRHKVKRIISDKKLTAAEKESLFFLCDGEKLLYISGLATADEAFCPEGGGDALNIFYFDKSDIRRSFRQTNA